MIKKEQSFVSEYEFSSGPHSPDDSLKEIESLNFSLVKESMTNGRIDSLIVQKIESIFERWRENSETVEPLNEMQDILEQVRNLPRSYERVVQMNSIIRTLGRPDTLATFLDMLRNCAIRSGTLEQEFCKTKLQKVKMHSIYGWCGNTLIVESLETPVHGTSKCVSGLGERLGNSPSAWNLTIHVWQPNIKAKGFPIDVPSGGEDIILEPPHSHPFDFVSTVVKGEMHQSIYSQQDSSRTNPVSEVEQRYSQFNLDHVDGVWPPHDFRKTCNLDTLEHRVELKEGDSYFMPCNWIHDVEINRDSAVSRPTITLFLSSEYMVMPHVYMAPPMADFHSSNPDVKKNGCPIPENAWHDKLKSLARYLRNESTTLDMNNIINHQGEYAFFHIPVR